MRKAEYGSRTPSTVTLRVPDWTIEVHAALTDACVGAAASTALGAGASPEKVVTGAAMVNVQLFVAVLPAASATVTTAVWEALLAIAPGVMRTHCEGTS